MIQLNRMAYLTRGLSNKPLSAIHLLLLNKPYTQHHNKKSRDLTVDELKLIEYGNPETSVSHFQTHLDDYKIKPGEIMVKLIGAPINPADINIIQGKYAFLPDKLPAVLGNEGAFEVVKTNQSNKFEVGDVCVATSLGWGTWRSFAIENETAFAKLPVKLDKHTSASITVNPCTAYRMLNDFIELNENDTIIQNGANSAVGQAVIQFAKAKNVNVINIVRKRENMQELQVHLESLGAKFILTDEDLRHGHVTKELLGKIKKPKLALNCVGGKIATDMVRLMDKDSVMVTYGGMSRLPLHFNTADFIFKNFHARGFWLTEWRKNHADKFDSMLSDICNLMKSVQFKPPNFVEFKLDDYKNALHNSQVQFSNQKSLFIP